MSDLRLKVRNKIYTSGNHIVDTKNNNNAIIVFLGKMSSEKLQGYIESFLKDTLKSQISKNKITCVQIDNENFENLPEILGRAVKQINFNAVMKNQLYISFVTVMDDELYTVERKIDISSIEELKLTALGGYSVEIFYDFYGIFVSEAKYENRANARKTILNFLDTSNGGMNILKRAFHQACPGDDYYRSSKSISFMILVILIEKINPHSIENSVYNSDSYTWSTFALFEKNLASLVIYEMINKLLENQVNGIETVAPETIEMNIKNSLAETEKHIKTLASVNDINYIPVIIKKSERELGFKDKFMKMFSSEKVSNVFYRKENEEVSIEDLLIRQRETVNRFIEENITDGYAESVIMKLINLCTVMNSINNNQNEALILKCLLNLKSEIKSLSENPQTHFTDYYQSKYNEIIADAKIKIIDKIIDHFMSNINDYVEKVQNHWNEMNIEVCNMINDFAAFQNHFEGISDLIEDKTVNLLCTHDDILDKIEVQRVIKAINNNPEIYKSVLSSYYDNVLAAGEIAQRFGNRPITPDMGNIHYCLFSSLPVNCPGNLKIVDDDYWFRDHEIAILFTAKNNISDCNNLPFGY